MNYRLIYTGICDNGKHTHTILYVNLKSNNIVAIFVVKFKTNIIVK